MTIVKGCFNPCFYWLIVSTELKKDAYDELDRNVSILVFTG